MVLSVAALVVAGDVATKHVAITVWATDPVSEPSSEDDHPNDHDPQR